LNGGTRSVKAPNSATRRPTVVLSAAGFDPSAGAGILADLKVFTAHGLYGVSAITAITVQSTQGVVEVHSADPEIFGHTLECLFEDMPIAGVKIGMLGSADIVAELARFLRDAGIARERIVLDPVLVSSSGAALLDPEGIRLLREELLPLVGWVTPNVDELAALTGERVSGREEVAEQAGRLAGLAGGLNVVVTGGHLDPPDDLLRTSAGEVVWFPGRRVDTTSTHGTGCVFASALLCRLVAGDTAAEAVRGAKEFVTRALASAMPVGKGKGPVLSGLR
jgi:hydroxymethylpyrimidine/phosphomethylpyrimidine kinase